MEEAAPAAIPTEKPEEIASEPTGEPPEKVEANAEPEAAKSKESGKEPQGDHAPAWFRKLEKQRKREIKEAREEIAALQKKLAAKRTAEPAAAIPEKEPAAPVEPQEADFNGDTIAYLRAVSRFDSEQIHRSGITAFQASIRQQLEMETREEQQRQVMEAQTKLEKGWARSVDESCEIHEDFDDVVFHGPGKHISRPMADYIAYGLENPGETAYFVSSKPGELARLAVLPQVQWIRELVKIDAQFSKKVKETPETKTRPNGSPKPEPIVPLGSGNSPAMISDIDDPAVVRDFPRWERMETARRERENRR